MASNKQNFINYIIKNINNNNIYNIDYYIDNNKQTNKKIIDNYIKLSNNKTIFYVQNSFSFYDKKYKSYKYFKDLNNNTFIYFKKYFAYYYKYNNYTFRYKYDNNIINNSKPYPKYLTYKPLDFNDQTYFITFIDLIPLIIYYHLKNNINYTDKLTFQTFYDKYYNYFKYYYGSLDDYMSLLINLYNTSSYNDIILYYNNYYKDYIKVDNKILKKIYLINRKYYNENLLNFCYDINDENFYKYINSINLIDLIIDQFNISTFFIYNNKINNNIISFYKYFINYLNYINDFNLIFQYILSSLFDIMCFINFNDDFEKYNNYVFYVHNNFHHIIFELYLNHFINIINNNKYNFISYSNLL